MLFLTLPFYSFGIDKDSNLSIQWLNWKGNADLPWNSVVDEGLDFWTPSRRESLFLLSQSQEWYDWSQKVHTLNFPRVFQYLPILSLITESEMNDPFSLPYIVAIQSRLFIDEVVDERFDFKLSSNVAIQYLTYLQTQWILWPHTFLAYLSSSASLNAACERVCHKDISFVLSHMNKDIQVKYGRFIAGAALLHFNPIYSAPTQASQSNNLVSVLISGPLHFKQMADLLGVSSKRIHLWNPSVKNQHIPAGYSLNVLLDSDLAHKWAELSIKETSTFIEIPVTKVIPTPPKESWIRYTIKYGDSLLKISAKYRGVSVEDIKRWNNLKSDFIREGQILKIKLP
jgi:LysM repeat protein